MLFAPGAESSAEETLRDSTQTRGPVHRRGWHFLWDARRNSEIKRESGECANLSWPKKEEGGGEVVQRKVPAARERSAVHVRLSLCLTTWVYLPSYYTLLLTLTGSVRSLLPVSACGPLVNIKLDELVS